ncbi:MAG: TlpA family protein disulfide reductase [Opitutaceae bacterium]|nr:TlpA family protein disulfide reductase [Opitutaceae bacterium]
MAAALRAAPAAWPVPAGIFPLGDERMEAWSAQRRENSVLTGRVLNLTDEQRAKAGLSASLVTLRATGQETLAGELRPDGTFRLEVPATFPRQQLWLRIRPVAYLEIILAEGLHMEIDAARLAPASAEAHPGLTFTGPDGELNSEVNRFVFAFQKDRRLGIERRQAEAARGKTGTFAERLAALIEARRDYEALLREFAPKVAGWFLQHEIEAGHHDAVLQAAVATRQPLESEPFWPEIARHAAFGVTNDQAGFLRALKSYFLTLHTTRRFTPRDSLPDFAASAAEAPPELQAVYREALALAVGAPAPGSAEAGKLAAAVARLQEAGVVSAHLLMMKRVREAAGPLLPRATIDLMSLTLVPRDASEARTVIAELQREAAQLWLLRYLDEDRRATDRRVAAINTALAQSAPPAGGTATPLGAPQAVLPAGAALHHLPDLGGRELLGRIRAAFPGKALVLDFWGPWCSPCMAELPHSARMHAALRGEPVEFVYLGSRTTDAPWRRAIAELRLGGTHVLLAPAQVDELMAFFGLGGFPGYAFIDRQGEHRPRAISRFSAMKPDDIRRLLR